MKTITFRNGSKTTIFAKGITHALRILEIKDVQCMETLEVLLPRALGQMITSLCIEKLWHQRPGNVNYKMLQKLSKFETIRRFSKIHINQIIFMAFASWETEQKYHKRNQHLYTTRLLELLYKNLMIPIQTANITKICGKKVYHDCCE